jgi:transaldolase
VTRLQQLFAEQGQSPWLDNIKRSYLRSGELGRLVGAGIRGVTANPTIFAHAIAGSTDYDEQFRSLTERNLGVEDAYWDLVVDDIEGALRILRPVFDESGGTDGFVSVELPPSMAHDTAGSIVTARSLHDQIHEPNLFVKIPATAEGIPAIGQMIAEGRSINITLIFSLGRYDRVTDAYLAGLEAHPGDLSDIHSVASFFVSRVDTEVDGRLERIGSDEALGLRGKAAVAQAKLAYRLFRSRFSGPRWEALAARGARAQRPLWASTSTKNPAYSDTLYVDQLIGPDTVNTMPEQTIAAFEDHGTLSRSIGIGVDEAEDVFDGLKRLGVDMDDVGTTLEDTGVSGFAKSYDGLLATLAAKAGQLASHQ